MSTYLTLVPRYIHVSRKLSGDEKELLYFIFDRTCAGNYAKLSRKDIAKALNISLRSVDYRIESLEKKGFLNLGKTYHGVQSFFLQYPGEPKLNEAEKPSDEEIKAKEELLLGSLQFNANARSELSCGVQFVVDVVDSINKRMKDMYPGYDPFTYHNAEQYRKIMICLAKANFNKEFVGVELAGTIVTEELLQDLVKVFDIANCNYLVRVLEKDGDNILHPDNYILSSLITTHKSELRRFALVKEVARKSLLNEFGEIDSHKFKVLVDQYYKEFGDI